MPTVKSISVDNLVIDPVQSRVEEWAGDDEDMKLAESIKTEGLMQDLLVRPVEQTDLDGDIDASHSIIAGSRRYHAALTAGEEELRCKVLDADDLEAAWKSLKENEDRKELTEQEVARSLKIIFEMVRPESPPEECPKCHQPVDGERGLSQHIRRSECSLPDFEELSDTTSVGRPSPQFSDISMFTDRQAYEYIAKRYRGEATDAAVRVVQKLISLAELPDELQALFKRPEQRSTEETMTLENFGIDVDVNYSAEGGGISNMNAEISRLHDHFSDVLDDDGMDEVNAVLKTVGSLDVGDMTKDQIKEEMEDFRRSTTEKLERADTPAEQRGLIEEELDERGQKLREKHADLEKQIPFRNLKFELEEQRHIRWHEQARIERDESSHSRLVRELYQERLEELAEEKGW